MYWRSSLSCTIGFESRFEFPVDDSSSNGHDVIIIATGIART